MWDLIVSVPDHCLSFYFGYITMIKPHCSNVQDNYNIFSMSHFFLRFSL